MKNVLYLYLTKTFLDTHGDFVGLRYGGWTVANGSKEYLERVKGTPVNLVSWFNNKGYHALPSYLNALNNAILRARVLSWKQPTDNNDESIEQCVECEYGITAYAWPMKLRGTGGNMETFQIISNYGTGLIMMVAFSFVPSSSIIYLVGERQREEKQVYMLSYNLRNFIVEKFLFGKEACHKCFLIQRYK